MSSKHYHATVVLDQGIFVAKNKEEATLIVGECVAQGDIYTEELLDGIRLVKVECPGEGCYCEDAAL